MHCNKYMYVHDWLLSDMHVIMYRYRSSYLSSLLVWLGRSERLLLRDGMACALGRAMLLHGAGARWGAGCRGHGGVDDHDIINDA